MAFFDLVAKADRAAIALLGGEVVTYKPLVGLAVPVTGIFDSQFVLVKGDAMAGVEAAGPAVFFRLSDLPVDPELDTPTLTIDGLVYRVVERMPDGLGGIVLTLRLVS